MKNSVIALVALLMVGAVVGTGAYAYPWNGMGGQMMQSEDIQQALENQDYEAFKAAVSEEAQNRVTEEMFAQMTERYQNRQTIREALENGDYQAWKNAVEAARPPSITDVVTEENFNRYMEMHNARQNGDSETANQIAEELGIQPRSKGGFGGGLGCPMGGMGGHRFGDSLPE